MKPNRLVSLFAVAVLLFTQVAPAHALRIQGADAEPTRKLLQAGLENQLNPIIASGTEEEVSALIALLEASSKSLRSPALFGPTNPPVLSRFTQKSLSLYRQLTDAFFWIRDLNDTGEAANHPPFLKEAERIAQIIVRDYLPSLLTGNPDLFWLRNGVGKALLSFARSQDLAPRVLNVIASDLNRLLSGNDVFQAQLVLEFYTALAENKFVSPELLRPAMEPVSNALENVRKLSRPRPLGTADMEMDAWKTLRAFEARGLQISLLESSAAKSGQSSGLEQDRGWWGRVASVLLGLAMPSALPLPDAALYAQQPVESKKEADKKEPSKESQGKIKEWTKKASDWLGVPAAPLPADLFDRKSISVPENPNDVNTDKGRYSSLADALSAARNDPTIEVIWVSKQFSGGANSVHMLPRHGPLFIVAADPSKRVRINGTFQGRGGKVTVAGFILGKVDPEKATGVTFLDNKIDGVSIPEGIEPKKKEKGPDPGKEGQAGLLNALQQNGRIVFDGFTFKGAEGRVGTVLDDLSGTQLVAQGWLEPGEERTVSVVNRKAADLDLTGVRIFTQFDLTGRLPSGVSADQVISLPAEVPGQAEYAIRTGGVRTGDVILVRDELDESAIHDVLPDSVVPLVIRLSPEAARGFKSGTQLVTLVWEAQLDPDQAIRVRTFGTYQGNEVAVSTAA